jgi:hypothetical protein
VRFSTTIAAHSSSEIAASRMKSRRFIEPHCPANKNPPLGHDGPMFSDRAALKGQRRLSALKLPARHLGREVDESYRNST